MSQMEFGEDLRTGIDGVDEQHATLIDIYNRLDLAFGQGKANREMAEILARLFQYTKIHFETEESLMERYHYPGLADHRREHEQLVEKLRRFVVRFRRQEERISREMLDFVSRWIVHHIQESDQAFADPLRVAMSEERQVGPAH